MSASRALSTYRRKRVRGATPEPGLDDAKAASQSGEGDLRFVVQLHHARSRHFDFRLELDGVLLSWAVPKGPSLDPATKRLAVEVEAHPLDYRSFEGRIPDGHYGAGDVLIWDEGVWLPKTPAKAALRKGHLNFELHGERLRGDWSLIRTTMRGGKPQWLLMKTDDAAAVKDDVADDRGLSDVRPASRSAAARKTKAEKGVVAAFPKSIDLPLARLVQKAPAGDDWLHEVKFDGYRVLLFRHGKIVRVESRNGEDYTAKLPAIVAALRRLRPTNFVLDAELVALDDEGRSRFGLLQRRLGTDETLDVMIFDAPYLAGRDLRTLPLLARKAQLASIAFADDGPLHRVEHHAGDGPALAAAACKSGLEGLISKAADSPYRGGRGGDWLKTKCIDSAEFVVVGYTPGKGARAALGALLLASPMKGDAPWRYVGRVGTGMDDRMLARLSKTLKPTKKPVTLDEPPTRAQLLGATPVWVLPRLIAEVEFRGWTDDGKLRQASFKTLRRDRTIAQLRSEASTMAKDTADMPTAKKSSQKNHAKPALTHPERQLFDDPVVTKADIAAFYSEIADLILPELVRRPLSMLRCPDGTGGTCFFQKHLTPGFGAGVHEFKSRKRGERLPYIEDLNGLIGLVQMNVIELHPWGATIDDVERPDRLVFDLDPGPGVTWKAVIKAAREVRERLEHLHLESFVRTSGGKGLHVVLPLSGSDPWPAAKAFAHALAKTMAQDAPDDFVDVAAKSKRDGRIFIDYLRNTRGATSVASYSLRARPGAAIATPLRWDELGRIRSGDQFGFRNLRKRLARVENPWAGIADVKQALPSITR